MIAPPIKILKSAWTRLPNGRWGVHAVKAINLDAQPECRKPFFKLKNGFELMCDVPSSNMREALASFGGTDFLIKQSIVPIVSWRNGGNVIRCIGTGTIISCTGYVLTAAHVPMDPIEENRGAAGGSGSALPDDVELGVFIPLSSAYGRRGFLFCPIEKLWLWGWWRQSPLLHEPERFEYATDVAICKIPELPDGAAHQPLGMSLNAFSVGEHAYSIGYAEMPDIPITYRDGELQIEEFAWEVFVSIGVVQHLFAGNHLTKDVPTPGPCFDFNARIPGKMSGAPIFGAKGVVIRGVVSRSFSGEEHAYGAMLGAALDLPLNEPSVSGRTLRSLIAGSNEGIAQIYGAGL